MSDSKPSGSQKWSEVSLFYILVPRRTDDPSNVTARAELLFGEGNVTAGAGKPLFRAENLGAGLRLLRVSNSLDVVIDTLTRADYARRLGASQTELFTFGLTQRPMVVGFPRTSGVVSSPVGHAYRLTQLVRVDKAGLLRRMSDARGNNQSPRDFVSSILDALASVTSIDFRGDESHWLGDVVIAERPQGAAWWERVNTDGGKSCKSLNVMISTEFSESVHVQVRVTGLDGMCICDRLLEWRRGDSPNKRIDLQEQISTVFLRAWRDSELTLEETSVVPRSFNTRVDLVAATFSLNDKLTEKLEKSNVRPSETLARARRGQSSGMTVRVSSQMVDEPWSAAAHPERAGELLLPREPAYSYFPRNPQGRAEAILHFASLLSQAASAYLVDPWFDSIGAQALLARLRGDVSLTIITNLPARDDIEVGRLRRTLADLSVLGVPQNLKLVRLHTYRQDSQLFHDRFLLLQREGRWDGFVLTNSFSGLATQYPLFVVKTSPGLTARLLDEATQLLDSEAEVEQLWPPERRPDSAAKSTERGLFPLWKKVILSASGRQPRLGVSDRQLLLLGNAQNLLLFSGERVSWRVDAAACNKIVTAMVGRASGGTDRSTRRPRRSAFAGLDVGKATLVLGDLIARGLPVDAHAVALRLEPTSAHRIVRTLRATFRESSDLTRVASGMSLEVQQLRQTIASEEQPWHALRAGMELWGSHLRDRRPDGPSWGRSFAYAVLLYADPVRAVRLCEELVDPDLVMTLVSLLNRRVDVPTEEMGIALASSRYPTLRGLGVQILVADAAGQAGSIQISRPSNAVAAVKKLDEIAFPRAETAYCLASWGLDHPSSSADLANALVETVSALPPEVANNVAEFLFRHEPRSNEFLQSLVGALHGSPRATPMLQALVDRFGMRFRPPREDPLYFSAPISSDTTKSIADAARALAKILAVSASEVVQRAAQREKVEAELVPLSPFRRLPAADSADVALGWILLWDLLASVGPTKSDGTAELPDEVFGRVKAYLATKRVGVSTNVRELLTRIVGF